MSDNCQRSGKGPRFAAMAIRHYIAVLEVALEHATEDACSFNNDIDLYKCILKVLEEDRWPDNEGCCNMSDQNVLQIALDQGALRALKTIQQELGVEDGDAIGVALGTETLLLERTADGSKVVIIDKKGRHQEVILRSI